MYTSSAESLSLLRAMPRRNTRGLCSQGNARPTEKTKSAKDKLILLNNVKFIREE
jgi:hypothetical protein